MKVHKQVNPLFSNYYVITQLDDVIGISDGIHTCHHHSPDTFFMKGGSIKDMAWMVIAGDGLHNFSDGLAIGKSSMTSLL